MTPQRPGLKFLPFLLIAFLLPLRPVAAAQDLGAVLQKADTLLGQARSAYDDARSSRSLPAFVEAGFKLEDARIKYLVLQEIGTPEQQRTAAERLRAVNQLMKLVNDGRVAINAPPASEPAPAPKPLIPDAAPKPEQTAAPVPSIELTKRHPVPEAKSLKDAEKQIRDLFKTEYAKKTPVDRIALAKTLLQQAAKTLADPAATWVLCRDAQDLAVQAGDVQTALAAVDEMARAFDVDAIALRMTALTAVGKSAKQPSEFRTLAEALLALLDELIATDQYEAADKAAVQAQQFSRRSGDSALSLRTTTRMKDVAEAKSRFTGMKKVLEALARNSDDPPANLEMGQFLCFVKGSWDLGLRFLAKGSDAVLKTLAERELALTGESAALVLIADGWWDLAEKEKPSLRKGHLLAHARLLYEAAKEGASGLVRIRIEKRLDALDIPVPGTINLLRMIDPAKDAVAGTWSFKDGRLWSDNTRFGRLEIPFEPPVEYDFRIVFTRHEGMGDIQQILTRGKGTLAWALGTGSGPFYAGFGSHKNNWVDQPGNPWTQILPDGLSNSRTYTSLVQVRKDGAKGYLDDKLIKELKSFDNMSNHPLLNLRSESTLGVGSYQSVTSFQKIELIEITGKGKKTRP